MASNGSLKDDTIHGLSTAELETLKLNSLNARNRAYCPYSHFRVGAALLTTSGEVILGANVENAAYPVTTCAERTALVVAVTNVGIKRGEFKAIGVATDTAREMGKGPCSPCGMCRQALREFCDLSMPVFMYYKDGTYVVKTLGELLPMSFGPDNLPPPEALPNFE